MGQIYLVNYLSFLVLFVFKSLMHKIIRATSTNSNRLKKLTPKNKLKWPPIEASNEIKSICGDSVVSTYERLSQKMFTLTKLSRAVCASIVLFIKFDKSLSLLRILKAIYCKKSEKKCMVVFELFRSKVYRPKSLEIEEFHGSEICQN